MEDSFFGQKETGAERVAMATALRASFCFLCDGQLFLSVGVYLFPQKDQIMITLVKQNYVVTEIKFGIRKVPSANA